MVDLAQQTSPDRAALERAALAFFDQLAAEIDQPRGFDDAHFDEQVAFNVEASRVRISELDQQLVANEFDRKVVIAAERLIDVAGGKITDPASPERRFAHQLAARAEREQLERLIHMLTSAAKPFEPQDGFFAAKPHWHEPSEPARFRPTIAASSPSLRDAVADYLRRKADAGVGASTVEEIGRVLGWLQERLGPSLLMDDIRKDEVRGFRDDLVRLDKRMKGKAMPFADRLAVSPNDRISSYTSQRYWRSVQGFLDWCAQEGVSTTNVAAGLKVAVRKGEVKRTPEAFTASELKALFHSPLFVGCKSASRLLQPGSWHRRLDHFWSAILPMFTGLRAGELAQLLPGDFLFDGKVPHLKVRTTDEDGNVTKTTKTASSVRDVPIAPILIELGLREFVHARGGGAKGARLFRGIRVGANRQSDGLTKFWTRYLKAFDLWKPGRATHVWRHSLVGCLRANGVAEEDIAAFVGHSIGTITSQYGGPYPVERKMKTALLIDYGFDVVAALGGAYNSKRHR